MKPPDEQRLDEDQDRPLSRRLMGRALEPPRSAPAGPSPLSPSKRWRFRRNLVIYIASQHGASQRLLADVFDLPHSRIGAIVKELRQRHGGLPPPRP